MLNLQKVIVGQPAQAGEYVFSCIKDLHDSKQLKSIGLATGSTMMPVYQKWRQSSASFNDVVTFNLDEYVGLSADNCNSYSYFMHQELFNHVTFKSHYLLNGVASNLQQACEDYEQALQDNPLDLQLLGVGENGHIAFNEPGTSIDSVTHLAQLTDSTINVNSRFFEEDDALPTQALTMGIKSILNAKRIIIVILGEKKRAALEKLYAGKVDDVWPITYLLQHPHVTVVTDLV